MLLLSVARTTHFRAIAIEETFSVVMTRQQQQRDEGDDANIALIQVPIGDSGEHVSIDPRNLSRTNVEDIPRRPPIGIGPVASVVGVRESVLGRG